MITESAARVSAEAILNSLSSGVVAIDRNHRVQFINSALAQRIGKTAEQCRQLEARELFRHMTAGVAQAQTPLYRLHALMASERPQSREVKCVWESEVIHLREDSGPLRDGGGEICGRVFAYHDLSWEKTMDRMKSDFISIASHELRTPMTSIKGAIDLILEGVGGTVSAETAELLKVGRAASERMIRLINDLLDLSKIEAGQIGLKPAPVDLRGIVDRCMRNLKVMADADRIRLRIAAAEQLPQAEADEDRIEQVVMNLLSNAIKYSPAGAEVTAELAADGDWIRCTIADQGCGIKEEDLDRIFGKFQQAGSPLRGAGTGLGLAITRALVIEHGGKIWAESRVGQGSRFIFCLPLKSKDAAGEPASPQS